AEFKQNKVVDSPVTAFNKLFPESDDQLLNLLFSALREKITDPLTKNIWAESLEYIILPKFYLTHNSDQVTKLIGGHKDVPITVKHKNRWVIEIINIVIIDDGETDYLLCLGTPYIRKVKGFPDLDKYEFQMSVC
ncbi:3305_t:CDS:2, partial [Diversispora eburnea]